MFLFYLDVRFFFLYYFLYFCFFFFKQKTAYEMRISDWSSDVCSSDLPACLHPSNLFYLVFSRPKMNPASSAFCHQRMTAACPVFCHWKMNRASPVSRLQKLRRTCRRMADRKSTRLNSSH